MDFTTIQSIMPVILGQAQSSARNLLSPGENTSIISALKAARPALLKLIQADAVECEYSASELAEISGGDTGVTVD
jgi:hypothetical protein